LYSYQFLIRAQELESKHKHTYVCFVKSIS